MRKLLMDLGIPAVPHGFRASFRSWCADTGVPREVAEAALGHVVAGVEGAYCPRRHSGHHAGIQVGQPA